MLERGSGWERPIGHVVGGGSGRIAFAPAPGPSGRRAIVAEVEQYGHPRTERVVASYVAPPPARLHPPAGLHAVRRGTSLIVSWRGVPGAMAYLVEVTAGRGHAITTVVRGRRFTFTGLATGTLASVAVRALDSRQRSAASLLRVEPAKRKGRGR
jgi:hypothetical protein